MSNSSGTWIESVSPSLVEGVVSAGVLAGGVGGLVNPGFSVEGLFDSVIVSISSGEAVCSGFPSVTSSSVVVTVVVVVVVAVVVSNVVEVAGVVVVDAVVVVVVVEVVGVVLKVVLRTTVGLGPIVCPGGDDVDGRRVLFSPDLGLSILTRVL